MGGLFRGSRSNHLRWQLSKSRPSDALPAPHYTSPPTGVTCPQDRTVGLIISSQLAAASPKRCYDFFCAPGSWRIHARTGRSGREDRRKGATNGTL